MDFDDLFALIESSPEQATAAWEGMTAASAGLPTLDGMRPFTGHGRPSLSRFWAAQIIAFEVADEFLLALRGQGVVIPGDDSQLKDKLWKQDFQSRAKAFRCLVLKNGTAAGSGIIVGPTTVVTAWHVIAVQGPGVEQEPAPQIEVQLADGRRIEAEVPVRAYSECGPSEYPSGLPASDEEVSMKSDVAVLVLNEPLGLQLRFPTLGTPQPDYPGSKPVAVVQYPNGAYLGIGSGHLRRLGLLNARWGHDVASAVGSSGGGCFDTAYRLIGIHQGRAPRGRGRLVPISRFPAEVIQRIVADEVPASLWSIDGTIGTSLVFGREQFFRSYHAVMRGSERARGIWIRRTNLRDASGLGFSFRLLESLVARSPTTRVVRISFDSLIRDHPGEIARRVRDAGLDVLAPDPELGVGHDETEPEAVVADRSRRLAGLINAAAREQGILLWLFFDHPNVLFGDEPRWAVTAFADQALRLDALRTVLAGYEAVQMAGERFQQSYDAVGSGGPGRMIEYLNGFTVGEVVDVVIAAVEELGGTTTYERAVELAEEATAGLVPQAGRYRPWMAATIDERLRPRIAAMTGASARRGQALETVR